MRIGEVLNERLPSRRREFGWCMVCLSILVSVWHVLEVGRPWRVDRGRKETYWCRCRHPRKSLETFAGDVLTVGTLCRLDRLGSGKSGHSMQKLVGLRRVIRRRDTRHRQLSYTDLRRRVQPYSRSEALPWSQGRRRTSQAGHRRVSEEHARRHRSGMITFFHAIGRTSFNPIQAMVSGS